MIVSLVPVNLVVLFMCCGLARPYLLPLGGFYIYGFDAFSYWAGDNFRNVLSLIVQIINYLLLPCGVFGDLAFARLPWYHVFQDLFPGDFPSWLPPLRVGVLCWAQRMS